MLIALSIENIFQSISGIMQPNTEEGVEVEENEHSSHFMRTEKELISLHFKDFSFALTMLHS